MKTITVYEVEKYMSSDKIKYFSSLKKVANKYNLEINKLYEAFSRQKKTKYHPGLSGYLLPGGLIIRKFKVE